MKRTNACYSATLITIHRPASPTSPRSGICLFSYAREVQSLLSLAEKTFTWLDWDVLPIPAALTGSRMTAVAYGLSRRCIHIQHSSQLSSSYHLGCTMHYGPTQKTLRGQRIYDTVCSALVSFCSSWSSVWPCGICWYVYFMVSILRLT